MPETRTRSLHLIHTQKLQNPPPCSLSCSLSLYHRALNPRASLYRSSLTRRSPLTILAPTTAYVSAHSIQSSTSSARSAAEASPPRPCYIPFAFVFLIYDGPSIFYKGPLFAYRNNLTFPSRCMHACMRIQQGDENSNRPRRFHPRTIQPPLACLYVFVCARRRRLPPFKFYYNKEIFSSFSRGAQDLWCAP
jgi:hypothetical protein